MRAPLTPHAVLLSLLTLGVAQADDDPAAGSRKANKKSTPEPGAVYAKNIDANTTSTEPTVLGSLDKALVQQVINQNRGQTQYCYKSQLEQSPQLHGTVTMKFAISASGSVATSSVESTTTNNKELESCLEARVRTWTFPKPTGGGVVIVTYPFEFGPDGHAETPRTKQADAAKVCRTLSADDCCEIAWNFFHGKNGVEQDREGATALFRESCRIFKKTKKGETASMCCSMVPSK